jgi:hypothetical protein
MVTKTRVKSKAKQDMTKAELIAIITKKTKKIPLRFQPMVRQSFLRGLRYKTKSELRRIATRMKIEVDRHGWDISIN